MPCAAWKLRVCRTYYLRGDRDGGHTTPNAFLPLTHKLGSRAPRLAKLEVHDTSLQNTAFALMYQGLKNGKWFGLTKLQLANCHLTIDDLKIFTAALLNMKDAVFHRLLTIDLSGNPSLGASCGGGRPIRRPAPVQKVATFHAKAFNRSLLA